MQSLCQRCCHGESARSVGQGEYGRDFGFGPGTASAKVAAQTLAGAGDSRYRQRIDLREKSGDQMSKQPEQNALNFNIGQLGQVQPLSKNIFFVTMMGLISGIGKIVGDGVRNCVNRAALI